MSPFVRASFGVRLVRFMDSAAGIFLLLETIIAGVLIGLGAR